MSSTKTDKNIVGLFRLIGELDGQHFIKSPNFEGIRCDHSIWPNILFNASFYPENLSAELPNLLTNIENGTLPKVIMFDPEVDHAKNIEFLKKKGFRHGIWTAMTAKLNQPETIESVLEIQKTTDLRAWVKCVESTLMGKEKLEVPIFEKLENHPSIAFLEGRCEGEIVSTALVFIDGTSAGLLLVGTEQEYRKQGFGNAITLAAKNLALENGCSEMYLHATTAGKSTYLACGFNEIGSVDVFNLSLQKEN
jgi:GNAT superfamily N-acetyltransferase